MTQKHSLTIQAVSIIGGILTAIFFLGFLALARILRSDISCLIVGSILILTTLTISRMVIRSFLDTGLLYEDAKYHNCVFVGRDARGTPVFASRRGTYDLDGSSFKRDVPGSDKRVAFRLPSRSDLDWVLVFEAPIDLMSYLTLHRQVTSNAVALCGVYGGALESYLKDYPHIKQIGLCLDVDEPGRVAAEHLHW